MDVQSKILDLLSMMDFIRAAAVCASWRLKLVTKMEGLGQAHISFQLDSIIRDHGFITGTYMDDPTHIPVPMLQGLGRALNAVCFYLSTPHRNEHAIWLDSEGRWVARHPRYDDDRWEPLLRYAAIRGHVTDQPSFFRRGEVKTYLHLSIDFFYAFPVPSMGDNGRSAKHLYVQMCCEGERTRDGHVRIVPTVFINLRHPQADSTLLCLSTLLVLCKQLGAAFQMLLQRLAPGNTVPALPPTERGTVLLSAYPAQFTKLGWLLLRRSFHESNFDVQPTFTNGRTWTMGGGG